MWTSWLIKVRAQEWVGTQFERCSWIFFLSDISTLTLSSWLNLGWCRSWYLWTAQAPARRQRGDSGQQRINLHRWGLLNSPTCQKYNELRQDSDHPTKDCSLTKLSGCFKSANECDINFKNWIETADVKVWPYEDDDDELGFRESA